VAAQVLSFLGEKKSRYTQACSQKIATDGAENLAMGSKNEYILRGTHLEL